MLVIRMARAGTKKRPFYHIVVADSRSPRDGRFIERLGYFNPLLPKDKTERLRFDLEKTKAWMAKGAQPSDRIMRFLDAAGVSVSGKSVRPMACGAKSTCTRLPPSRRRSHPMVRLQPMTAAWSISRTCARANAVSWPSLQASPTGAPRHAW